MNIQTITIYEEPLEAAIDEIMDPEGLGLSHEWNDYLCMVLDDEYLTDAQKRDSVRNLVSDIVFKYLGAMPDQHSADYPASGEA